MTPFQLYNIFKTITPISDFEVQHPFVRISFVRTRRVFELRSKHEIELENVKFGVQWVEDTPISGDPIYVNDSLVVAPTEQSPLDVIEFYLKQYGSKHTAFTIPNHCHDIVYPLYAKYCKNITELDLTFHNDKVIMKELRPIFEQVRRLHFKFDTLKYGVNYDFDDLFTSECTVEELFLHYYDDGAYPNIILPALKLPKLKSLKTTGVTLEHQVSTSKFLALNDQLERLWLISTNVKTPIQLISKYLPDLQELELYGKTTIKHIDGLGLKFNHLKIFGLQTHPEYLIDIVEKLADSGVIIDYLKLWDHFNVKNAEQNLSRECSRFTNVKQLRIETSNDEDILYIAQHFQQLETIASIVTTNYTEWHTENVGSCWE